MKKLGLMDGYVELAALPWPIENQNQPKEQDRQPRRFVQEHHHVTMDRDSVAELVVSELLYSIGGRHAVSLGESCLESSYNLVWRFAWVRYDLQRSYLRYMFI